MSLSFEQKLPTELVEHIISFACRNSLRSLCLTSKTLNRLATPYLYSEIYLKETDRLPALAHLIFTSPTHAALVKSFIVPTTWEVLEESEHDSSWPGFEDSDFHGVLKAKCSEYASNDEEADGFHRMIQSAKSEDAIMALLLVSLPKLRRLNINFGIGSGHDDFSLLWPRIMDMIRSRGEPLANGTRRLPTDAQQGMQLDAVSEPIDIMVTGSNTKYSNNTTHLAAFFHLPNLRCIYAWKQGDGEDAMTDTPFAKLKPRSCPVEYVELRCSKLSIQNFTYLLDATVPGKLKTFSYEIGGAWAWCHTEHPVIMRSLQPHHETLQALGLSHESFYPYAVSDAGEKPYPCSFTSFTALKRLKLAPVYIWGHQGVMEQDIIEAPRSKEKLWSALPRNLEELWITRAQNQNPRRSNADVTFVPNCLLPALDRVVQHKQDAVPKLQHLLVEFPLMNWEDEWIDALASICRAAAAQNIQTTLIACDMFSEFGPITAERHWGWNEDIKWEPTRYSLNRECAKVTIDATQQEHLGQILKDMKARFEEEHERYREAKLEIRSLGHLCTACQLDPEYDASRAIGRPERFVDERLGKEPYWRGREGRPDVVT
jgi:hypothetical protein